MKIVENKYIFENDEELTDFCICHKPTMLYSDKIGKHYYDYEETPEYKQACDNGVVFVVIDPESRAVKNGHISRGLITKKINCCAY
jgi:hypothetical protein